MTFHFHFSEIPWACIVFWIVMGWIVVTAIKHD